MKPINCLTITRILFIKDLFMLLKLKWFLIINAKERCQRKPFRINLEFCKFQKVKLGHWHSCFATKFWLCQNLNFFIKKIWNCFGNKWFYEIVSLYVPNIFRVWFSKWRTTTLKASRSQFQFPMGSLGFFISLIVLPHHGPRYDSACNINENQGYLLVGKGRRCVGLTV